MMAKQGGNGSCEFGRHGFFLLRAELPRGAATGRADTFDGATLGASASGPDAAGGFDAAGVAVVFDAAEPGGALNPVGSVPLSSAEGTLTEASARALG
jgi:hypothetical protein